MAKVKNAVLAAVLVFAGFLAGCGDSPGGVNEIDITVYNDTDIYGFKITNTTNNTILEDDLSAGTYATYTIEKSECLQYDSIWLGSYMGTQNGCYEETQDVHLDGPGT